MRVAIAATIFFIIVVIISGTLTLPTQDDLILIFSSLCLLVMSWIYTKEKKSKKEGNKKIVNDK